LLAGEKGRTTLHCRRIDQVELSRRNGKNNDPLAAPAQPAVAHRNPLIGLPAHLIDVKGHKRGAIGEFGEVGQKGFDGYEDPAPAAPARPGNHARATSSGGPAV
jgi:hypothetical protein